MNTKGRIENSIRNSTVGIVSQTVNLLLGLVGRTVFIRCLSAEYLGVNGLFSNILTILSLAELGIGSAIVYNMYKPIAENDELQVSKLMNFYRRAYSAIGTVVAVLGVCVVPFLDVIIKEKTSIPNIQSIYLLFLANTVVSYFFAYKRSIFTADQRDSTLKIFAIIFCIVRNALQICFLLLTRNYIVYLLILIGCTFLENVAVSLYADHVYPFLIANKHTYLQKSEKKPIIDNIKALFVYKVGGVVLDGTDNIIISALDGVVNVGLLSNYGFLTGAARSLLDIIGNALTASVGNYIAKEDENRHESMVNIISFIYFILYGVVFVGSISILDDFVIIWVGKEYILNFWVVFVHCLNIYVYGTLCGVWTFRTAMGLFTHGKWRPLIAAAINVIVSIWWAKKIGMLGVLLGTTFSRAVTSVWYDPYIIYKHGLHKSPVKYYLKWVLCLILVLIDIGLVCLVKQLLQLCGLLGVVVYGCIGVSLFFATTTIAFFRTQEYKYLTGLIKNVFTKVLNRNRQK